MQILAPSMQSTSSCRLRRRDDLTHLELIDRFGERGGLASTDELVHLMRPHWRQPISILAKWIIGRRALSFSWHSRILLPLFQFDAPRMTPKQVIVDCSIELGELVDDEGLAAWFVRPSEWLDGRTPLDLTLDDPDMAVEAAARTRLALAASRAAH
jgi:hypothetical protein